MNSQSTVSKENLLQRIADRDFTVGIIGMGYVGLPLAVAFGEAKLKVIGFDVDQSKADKLNAGKSYIAHIPSTKVAILRANKLLEATADMSRLREPDALLICVPTPITRHKEPNLSFVTETTKAISEQLRTGQIVILESTTYPNTTSDVVKPILQNSGLMSGQDFFLAYSPEREDPGNLDYAASKIPKVVGADDDVSRDIASALYATFAPGIVTVSSAATAEAVKITENVFRAVNIALANELKLVFGSMNINVWEVIDAAKTKPFGYMPFYPGPGLGGHCIPVDPFYLTWKAKEYNQHTKFIELAGQINSAMPEHVVHVLCNSLDQRKSKGLNGSKILILGVSYKKNVADIRESPSLRIMELIESRGGSCDFFDPHVQQIDETRDYPALNLRRGVSWNLLEFKKYDAVLIATDHDGVDYVALAENCDLIIDTRNVCAKSGVCTSSVVSA